MRCHIKEIISNVYISPLELCLKREEEKSGRLTRDYAAGMLSNEILIIFGRYFCSQLYTKNIFFWM